MAERSRLTVEQFLAEIESAVGDQPLAMSAVAYTELRNGFYRELDPARTLRRQRFFTDLLEVIPIHDYTWEMAEIAGRIGGAQALLGNVIPPVDLMIGATALFHGFSVLTHNLRHFRMIPGLTVDSF